MCICALEIDAWAAMDACNDQSRKKLEEVG